LSRGWRWQCWPAGCCWPAALWHALLAVLYLGGGVYFVSHPLLGLGSLTLFLAAILFIEGVVWVVAYFQVRSGNIWMLLNGVITLVLGVMIWRHWPSSSAWAIGTLLGVNLVMTGMSILFAGAALRKLAA
jgi:uncharacterized membrane protein HdeD (DUF308 family)